MYFMAKHGTLFQRFRVPLGFIFAAVFLIFAAPTPLTLLIGAIISVLGLFIRAWASGHIRKNRLWQFQDLTPIRAIRSMSEVLLWAWVLRLLREFGGWQSFSLFYF